MLFPTLGRGLVIIGTVTGTLGHQKNKEQEGPSRSPPEPVPPGQARGTLAGSFALMLHLFWDKTGCEYQAQATWRYCNHLANINRIKSCRDPHSPGCGSTRDFTPAVDAATWSGGPARALGTEGAVLLYPARCNCLHQGASLATAKQVTDSHLQAVTEELIPNQNTSISLQLPSPA